MEEYISRNEHEEFCKRMEDEHHRQNKRINILEESVKEVRDLTASVQKLAVNMENMLKSQEQQGERLKTLEERDGEKWRSITGYVLTTIVGILIGYIFKQIGM